MTEPSAAGAAPSCACVAKVEIELAAAAVASLQSGPLFFFAAPSLRTRAGMQPVYTNVTWHGNVPSAPQLLPLRARLRLRRVGLAVPSRQRQPLLLF